MTPAFDYSLVFAAGILGSAHCIGMCGGLVSAFFMRFSSEQSGILPYLAYHGARIGIYILIGVIAAIIGTAFISTGMLGKGQSVLQIVAGLVVILLGLDMLGLLPRRITFGFLPLNKLRASFIAAAEKGPVIGAMTGGAINGIMPCPLTLAIVIKAVTAPTPLEGGLLMLAFGLGTLPAMLFVSLIFGKLAPRLRSYMMRAAAVFVIVLGVNTIFAGIMHLGGGVQSHGVHQGMSESSSHSIHSDSSIGRKSLSPEQAATIIQQPDPD